MYLYSISTGFKSYTKMQKNPLKIIDQKSFLTQLCFCHEWTVLLQTLSIIWENEKCQKTSAMTSVFWCTKINKSKMILFYTLTSVKVKICWDENKIAHEFKNSQYRPEKLFDHYPTVLGTGDKIRSIVYCSCGKIFPKNIAFLFSG